MKMTSDFYMSIYVSAMHRSTATEKTRLELWDGASTLQKASVVETESSFESCVEDFLH